MTFFIFMHLLMRLLSGRYLLKVEKVKTVEGGIAEKDDLNNWIPISGRESFSAQGKLPVHTPCIEI